MPMFPWRQFLEDYSRDLLADRRVRPTVPESVVRGEWMGFDPATPTTIHELEARLGAQLPESYRQFLTTSNGWRQSGGFVYQIRECAKVEWFHEKHQEWIDAYLEPQEDEPPLSVEEHCVYGDGQNANFFQVQFLQSTLLISDIGDSAVYLLNPEIRTPEGEWEAWFFADWNTGATRYRSFWDLMQAERRSFIELREHNDKRFFPEDGVESLPPKLPGLVDALKDRLGSLVSAYQDEYSKGIVLALEGSIVAVEQIASLDASPSALLQSLTDLANELSRKWHEERNVPGDTGEHKGRGEGNRQAAGTISWFLNLD